jgi:hypothetical protein
MTPSTSPSKRANGPTSTPNTRFPTWLPPPEVCPSARSQRVPYLTRFTRTRPRADAISTSLYPCGNDSRHQRARVRHSDAFRRVEPRSSTGSRFSDIETIQRSFCRHVTKTLARTAPNLDNVGLKRGHGHDLSTYPFGTPLDDSLPPTNLWPTDCGID